MIKERIDEILDIVQSKLDERTRPQGVELRVDRHDSKLEDDWLYIVVTSPVPKVRPSIYSEWFSEVEKELREEDIDHVLLIPAVPD